MRPFLDDLRTAFRSLRQRPAFTTVVVLTLAVALGANTAVFSVLEQTLLRPLPFDGAERLVYLYRADTAGSVWMTPSHEQVRAWREGTGALEAAESFESTSVTLLGWGEPRELPAARITPGLFPLLGVRPLLGPGLMLDAGDDGSRRVVLGHRLWRELFGGSPRALGAALRLDDEVYTVAGVVGPELRRLPPVGEVDVWLPFAPGDLDRAAVQTLARLAPGVSADAAEERLTILEGRRSDAETAQWRPYLLGPAELFGRVLGRQLLVLQAAVGLMLLVGCANVGNLFLVRAAGRRRELAVRGALGAGRARIVRTLMLESLLVAGAGALLGLLFALWGGRALTRLGDWPLVDLDGLRLDPGLFAFSAGAAVLAAAVFGLLPALTASRSEVGLTLRSAAPGAGSVGGGRARALLAVAEVALSLMLVVGAGLLTRHFVALLGTETGFDLEGLVAVSADLPEERYGSPESRAAFLESLGDGLAGLGLDAALASAAPPGAGIAFGSLRTEGAPEPAANAPIEMVVRVEAGSGYFRTAGIPVIEGRPFVAEDVAGTGPGAGAGGEIPALINRRLADRLWPGGSPVGRRFALGDASGSDVYRVVGVAGDAAQLGIRGDLPFQLYTPLRDGRSFAVLLRSGETGQAAAVDRVVARIRALDPALPVRPVQPVEALLLDDLSGPRFQSALMLSFAGIALALASLGVYAVLAFSVRRRSFEIGVRSALGARPGQVLALIGRQGAAIAVAGVVLGTAGALAAARLLGTLLGEVPPHDPAVYALAVAVLLAACAAAILVPATRAARLDPVRVLRRE